MTERRLHSLVDLDKQRIMVMDEQNKPMGELQLSPAAVQAVVACTKDGHRPMHTTGEVIALIEEIRAKAYNVGVAKVSTLLETLLPEQRDKDTFNQGRLNHSLSNLLGYLMDDVTGAILQVAQKRAPEATLDTLETAKEARYRAEQVSTEQRTVNSYAYAKAEVDRLAETLRAQGLGHHVDGPKKR